MNGLKEKIVPQILIIYIRYLLGGAFVFASLIKIKGLRFTSESGALEPIGSAWHFFETMYQSGLYWKFIGMAQLIAGFLLMTQRFSKLGALINLPIILNVFIITLSYYFAYTPVITGSMLFANLLLIIWEWNEIKILCNYLLSWIKSLDWRKMCFGKFSGCSYSPSHSYIGYWLTSITWPFGCWFVFRLALWVS